MDTKHICLICDKEFSSEEKRMTHVIECVKTVEVDERIGDMYAYGD